MQVWRAELARVTADFESRRVRVTEGGKRLATICHHLQAAHLTKTQWRDKWGVRPLPHRGDRFR
ncbi:MAG TPA: hypothetical protein VLZ05_16720 [Mycobacterium sp.]|nr:hypothetical protein [Mycobacterium sp.]HUH70352.1 hypothetical protein [Mycobacterium sp.]